MSEPAADAEGNWRSSFASVRNAAILQGQLQASLIDSRAKNVANQDTAGVVLEVTTEEELAAVPLHEQGNLEMNRIEVVRQRFELRRNREVLEELHAWWETAQRSMRAQGIDASGMPHDTYVRICA
jgi:hypothetical protein|eukprot:6756154-Prymnesium_polylepis.1